MIEHVFIPGVPLRPWYKKINPIWWFGNDEGKASDTFTYKYVRNPLQNFRSYVIGFCDRPHIVTGPYPADQNLWLDLTPPQTGWKWTIVAHVFPFVSYSGVKFAFYFGWMPMGRFGWRLTW